MWTIQPEHSTENWNVICSLKSLCTQQIVGLDVFSTWVMWVSLVDSVQQSLIRVCPFLYHFWGKMNLCACFSYYQSLMKLLFLCWGSLGQLPWSRQMRGAGLTSQGVFEKCHFPQLLGLGSCSHSWGPAAFVEFTLKENLGLPWWCSGHEELLCHVPRSCEGQGERCVCWKRPNCLPTENRSKKPSCLPRQEADNVKNRKTEVVLWCCASLDLFLHFV